MSRLLKNTYVPQLKLVRNLVSDPKYAFLKQLGFTAENPGLFDGRWGGSGKVHDTILFILQQQLYDCYIYDICVSFKSKEGESHGFRCRKIEICCINFDH